MTVTDYRQIIESILNRRANVRYSMGDLHKHVIIDRERDMYMLLTQGWQDTKRIHSYDVHLDIIGDKIWIQEDWTEDGIATDLEEAGIPKNRIVLAFHPEDLRQYTGYAAS